MSLLDDMNNEAPRLKLERPGDGVYGTVVRLAYEANLFHESYPVVTVRTEDGRTIAVHCLWASLSRRVEELNLREGDEFAVVYDGEKTSASSGRTYRVFRAERRRS